MKKIFILSICLCIFTFGCLEKNEKINTETKKVAVVVADEENTQPAYEPIVQADLEEEPLIDEADEVSPQASMKRTTTLPAGTYTTISGIVTLANGTPVTGSSVRIIGTTYLTGKGVNRKIQTTSGGHFTIRNVIKGCYVLGAQGTAPFLATKLLNLTTITTPSMIINLLSTPTAITTPSTITNSAIATGSGIVYGKINYYTERDIVKIVGDNGTYYTMAGVTGNYKAILPKGKYSIYAAMNRVNHGNTPLTTASQIMGTVQVEVKEGFKTSRNMLLQAFSGQVWLIQDVKTISSAEDALTSLGVTFSKMTSTTLKNTGTNNFSEYDLIIFDAEQPSSFYTNINNDDMSSIQDYDCIFLKGSYLNTFKYATNFVKETNQTSASNHYFTKFSPLTSDYNITTKTSYASIYATAGTKNTMIDYTNKYSVNTFIGFNDASTIRKVIKMRTQKVLDFTQIED